MHLQKEHQKFAAGVWHKILMLLYHSRLKSSGKQSHWSFAEKNTTLHKKWVEQLDPESTGNCNIFEEDIKQPDYSVSGCQGQAWNPHAYNSRLNLLENKPLELCRIEQRFSQKGVEQLGPEPTGNCNIFEKNIKQSDYLSSVVLMNYGLTRLSTEQPYELLSLASWAESKSWDAGISHLPREMVVWRQHVCAEPSQNGDNM